MGRVNTGRKRMTKRHFIDITTTAAAAVTVAVTIKLTLMPLFVKSLLNAT